jgi:hypothetical protein
MATGKQLKGTILARRAAKGPRKKRTRPKPRQYTIADLERARDRVAAAERRIDNDRTNNPNRGRAGLERAQLELSVIESQLRLRGLLGSSLSPTFAGRDLTWCRLKSHMAEKLLILRAPHQPNPCSKKG